MIIIIAVIMTVNSTKVFNSIISAWSWWSFQCACKDSVDLHSFGDPQREAATMHHDDKITILLTLTSLTPTSSKSSCNNGSKSMFWSHRLTLMTRNKMMSLWSGSIHLQRCIIVNVLVSALSRRLPSNHLECLWWCYDENEMMMIWGSPHVRPFDSHAPGQWWEGLMFILYFFNPLFPKIQTTLTKYSNHSYQIFKPLIPYLDFSYVVSDEEVPEYFLLWELVEENPQNLAVSLWGWW